MEFKELIAGVLARGNLKQTEIEWVIDNHMEVYERAFTSKTHDPVKNYEDLEQKGDAAANDFLVWYFYNRFPQLDCPEGVPTIARLKIVYSSKTTFFTIAKKLNFWPYIRASRNEKDNRQKSLLEDVFEAFIGATVDIFNKKVELGFGNIIASRILTSLFDDIKISLEYNDLYDAKTRLKEYFDNHKSDGQLVTVYNNNVAKIFIVQPPRKETVRIGKLDNYLARTDAKNCTIAVSNKLATISREGENKTLIASATATTKAEAEQKASENALDKLDVRSRKSTVFC